MLLSQAIRHGRTLRPESHQEGWPFVRIANEDALRSDPWGAAVEAVHSPIIHRSWTDATYQADMAVFVELQRQHFGNYFHTPANCPGAQPRHFNDAHARITNSRKGEYIVEREGQRVIGPVTSDCHLILNLAEFVEHAYYIHNWTTEECARAVEYYEQGQQVVVAQNFEHYQDERVRQRIGQRNIDAAWQRELARRARRTGNRTYVH